MKVSKEQAAENRERILKVAAKLFRERGFAGIGVADLMEKAGLTHGGFYGHFKSKEDLMAQACEEAIHEGLKSWETALAQPDPLAAIVDFYLTPQHRDKAGSGCVAAALAVDAARHGGEVRKVMTGGLQRQVEILAAVMPDATPSARRERALAVYASFIGALVLARATDDKRMSEDFLKAVASATLEIERPKPRPTASRKRAAA